ncbi:hypothetical protein SprV_0200995500 [Sparganum proliferum]
MPRCIRIDDELAHRISKASQAFGRLQNSVWNRHDLRLNTKLKKYKAIVLTTLLCGAQTWTIYSSHTRRLNHPRSQLPSQRWQDRTPDIEVLERTRILSIHTMLRQLQLRWSGHLVRMDDVRLPERLFYGDVAVSLVTAASFNIPSHDSSPQKPDILRLHRPNNIPPFQSLKALDGGLTWRYANTRPQNF